MDLVAALRSGLAVCRVGECLLDQNCAKLWDEDIIVEVVEAKERVDITVEDLAGGEESDGHESVGVDGGINSSLIFALVTTSRKVQQDMKELTSF